ncbi:Chromosome partitioning ATPase, Mrp family, contains Fe-S cluster [Thalassococcus halodurans]|uniref:Chromosome partitioning ATPase, Mrp family, contains Fe-S cluster n=1 Tax=Thalassococcus halodurans TaxID=373675 RepID=A0A1H5YYQ4_9RHOB|nr:CpsD/CapB family tyrosine-protein kinase [Thalassococcus halodurans]SEG28565.1 Chromosome partitioning ATPase, Mrp family, contains Fe-S cluster [Thalassococcus halodurans]
MTQRPKFTRKKRAGAQSLPEIEPAVPAPQIDDTERKQAEIRARQAEEAAAAAKARAAEEEAERQRLAEQLRRVEEERKAEARRQAEAEQAAAAQSAQPEPEYVPDAPTLSDWDSLGTVSLDAATLDRHRIITGTRKDGAHTTFDVLRTRLLQALSEKGWKRVAITSPTQGCGKTFTAANLALSLSRQENCRTLLLDFDMRRPSLAKVLGVQNPGSIGEMLRGTKDPQDHIKRLGPNTLHAGQNIAFGLNDSAESYASELLLDPRTGAALDDLEERLNPDVILFDLPPALFSDDVLALQPHLDGVLLVVGGGVTTQAEIQEVESRLGEATPLLGIVLNKAEGVHSANYEYF